MKWLPLLLLAGPLQAEVIRVEVKGMVCSYCSQGLLKRAEKNKKIEKATLSLEKGEMQLITGSAPLLDAEIETLVEEAGFSVKSIQRIAE